MPFCDLHCHSTASDGTVPPEALAQLAKNADLTAIALTDHDTIEGLPACAAVANASDEIAKRSAAQVFVDRDVVRFAGVRRHVQRFAVGQVEADASFGADDAELARMSFVFVEK